MNRFCLLSLAIAGLIGGASSNTAEARHFGIVGFGHHSHHHGHVVRDRHGHIIGHYRRNLFHHGSTRIVPHSGSAHGSYFVRNGRYYYYPQTASAGIHTTNYRPEEIAFGSCSHIDDLALRLETMANELCLDLFYNYSHNFEFHVTYAEAYQVLEVARFIHDAEHLEDRDAMRSRLGGLDELFHHIQDDVRGWTRHHRRQIGHLGILSKMDLMEATLHHLMHDVGVSLGSVPGEQAPPPVGSEPEQAPLPATLPTALKP